MKPSQGFLLSLIFKNYIWHFCLVRTVRAGVISLVNVQGVCNNSVKPTEKSGLFSKKDLCVRLNKWDPAQDRTLKDLIYD